MQLKIGQRVRVSSINRDGVIKGILDSGDLAIKLDRPFFPYSNEVAYSCWLFRPEDVEILN